MLKRFFVICVIFSFSVHTFAQTEKGKYDRIRIKLNTLEYNPSTRISNLVAKLVMSDINSNLELLTLLTDYECVANSNNSNSTPVLNVNITLTSGTSWTLPIPPKQPLFFLPRVLFRSKNQAVVDRHNYVKFGSIAEATGDVPYDMIEKIRATWTLWDVENITTRRTIRTIESEGVKCVVIEYEIVPDLEARRFKIVNFELVYPAQSSLLMVEYTKTLRQGL